MGLTKEARQYYQYYTEHPEKIIIRDKRKEVEEEIERELNKLREKGIIIKTIKK
jgi:hypothetical protein